MENANQLFQAGKLNDAIQALNNEVRNHPEDSKRRIFLFELLCFAGEYDRAEKQLNVLGSNDVNKEMGALVYRSTLLAERKRNEMFTNKDYPKPAGNTAATGKEVSGTLNGKSFKSISDADPRIGTRLEVFAGGSYLWMNFEHLASVTMDQPKRLRDTLWAPAKLAVGPALKDTELGEILLPALTPFAWQDPEDAVRLGRMTARVETEAGEAVPVGQKMLLVDGEEFPLLEIRNLEINQPEPTA
jgi:type VI secretion system protein ImpE